MKIYSETSLESFEAWSGAVNTLDRIRNAGKREALEAILEYEGIIGYTGWIIDLIQDIYGVTLE